MTKRNARPPLVIEALGWPRPNAWLAPFHRQNVDVITFSTAANDYNIVDAVSFRDSSIAAGVSLSADFVGAIFVTHDNVKELVENDAKQ
jgi:hypothetical protein